MLVKHVEKIDKAYNIFIQFDLLILEWLKAIL
jgi:hypothetical protein